MIVSAEKRPKLPDGLEEIADKLHEMDMPEYGHIYFLLFNNEVVYVGQTTNLDGRMADHRRHKEFDRVLFMLVPVDQIFAIERYWIKKLDPPYNRTIGSGWVKPEHPGRRVGPAPISQEARENAADAIGLPLPPLVAQRLYDGGFKTKESVLSATMNDLIRVRGIGDRAVYALREALPHLSRDE